MLKELLTIGLSFTFILPPMPQTWKPVAINAVDNFMSVPVTKPAIFSNALDASFVVHTALIVQDDTLKQDVLIMDAGQATPFSLELINNDLKINEQQTNAPEKVFTTSRESFRFSQHLEGEIIQTKEWIDARQPNVTDGSVYRWRFRGDQTLSLKLLASGAVDIVDAHARRLAQIQPFEYWTRVGKKSVAQVSVEPAGAGEFLLQMQIHEPPDAYPLSIDPTINYGKWLGEGTAAALNISAVAYESANSEIYVAGNIEGSLASVATVAGTLNVDYSNGFVAEVSNATPPTINWLHYLGGDLSTTVLALAVNGDEVYVGGYVDWSLNWETAGSTAGTLSNIAAEAFVVEIADGNPPSLEWRHWLGGSAFDVVRSIAVDGDEIYAGGYSDSSANWETAGSSFGTYTNSGTTEAFLVEIADGGPPTLAWKMWIGGRGTDNILKIAVNGDEIYAVGYCYSSGSWDTAGSVAGTYTNAASTEGFLVEIADGGPPSLAFRLWLGGLGEDYTGAVAVNGDEIYVGGSSPSTASWETFGSTVGTFSNNGTYEGFLTEIADGGPPTYAWRMWIGGLGEDSVDNIKVNGDEIYAAGYTYSSASFDTFAVTAGTFSNDGVTEAYIVEIADGAPPTAEWLMWLGSSGGDSIGQMAINADEIFLGVNLSPLSIETFSSVYGTKMYSGSAGAIAIIDDGSPPTNRALQWLSGSGPSIVNALAVNGDEIYVGGKSGNESLGVIANVGTPNITSEGYVLEVEDSATPAINWRVWLGGEGVSQVYALQVNGDEIYAGGSTASSDSWDTAGSTVGTMTNTSNEGFVAEIADGSPPTLNWRMWLGGSDADEVLALALNGDEIYAGGVSAASGSWDTIGSIVGTYTNPTVTEGFVVEIGDGSPPTLDWLMWLGGVGLDRVTALGVVADEIYAAGYADSSASFETAGSTVGTFTNPTVNEGFVTEIADGAPPTLAWSMWTGGVGADQVLAMAVRANEIYAGGLSASFASWDTAAVVVGTFTNNGTNEGFVLEIADGAPPSVAWQMWLGGVGADSVQTLAVLGNEVYAGGYSYSSASWETASATAGTFSDSGSIEGFIAEISDGTSPTLNWRQWQGGIGRDSIASLAFYGDEIYAAGYALNSDGIEGVFQGTKHNGQNSAFIVEINDDIEADIFNVLFFGSE